MFSIATRRVPAALAGRAVLLRTYTSSFKEGSVAQSREFGKKERAEEEAYARRHDSELLQRLKAEIEEKQKQVDELEKKRNAESK